VAWACINFLRAKIHTAGFKQADWGYSSSPILSFRQSGDVPRRIGDWPAGHLEALDLEVHAAIPTVGLLIAVTLPPAIAAHRLATVSRLLPRAAGCRAATLCFGPLRRFAAARQDACNQVQADGPRTPSAPPSLTDSSQTRAETRCPAWLQTPDMA
jgi:hypothetical protein